MLLKVCEREEQGSASKNKIRSESESERPTEN